MTGTELQALIDSCAAAGGGVIEVPAGPLRIDFGIVFRRYAGAIPVLAPTVELRGQGISATTIYTLDPTVDLLRIERSNVRVRGMLLQGCQTSGSGRGVVIKDATNGSIVTGVAMSDVYIAATGQHALDVPAGYPHHVGEPYFDQVAVACSYDRCTFDTNLTPGSDLVRIGRWNTCQRFTNCNFTNFKGHALLLDGADTTSCRDCNFEAGDNTRPWVEGFGAAATLLDHCYFEDHALPSTAKFTKRDRASTDWVERDCTFRRPQP